MANIMRMHKTIKQMTIQKKQQNESSTDLHLNTDVSGDAMKKFGMLNFEKEETRDELFNLENLTPIMFQYKGIKAQYTDHLLFFRLGDFYELFYEDAVIASNVLDIVLTQRDKLRNPVPMCGIPAHASQSYIARLIKLGYRVAICEQVETPETKAAGTGPLKREVVRIITPGTIMDDILLEAKEYNFLLAISCNANKNLENANFGIAFVDISTGDIFTELQHYSSLDVLLSRLRPKEILITSNIINNESLQKIFTPYKSIIRSISSSSVERGIAAAKILRFYNVQALDAFGDFSSDEISSMAAILTYVQSTHRSNMPYFAAPQKLVSNDFLQIDDFTQKSLEILESNSSVKGATLLDVIDMTLTAGGARLLKMRLSSPLKNTDLIRERLDSVNIFVQNSEMLAKTRAVLKNMPDIMRAMSRISYDSCNSRDISTLRAGLLQIGKLREVLLSFLSNMQLDNTDFTNSKNNSQSGNHSCELINAIANVHDYSALHLLLSNTLEDSLPINTRDGKLIRRGYCSDLDDIYNFIESADVELENLRNDYALETGISSIKIKQNKILGYYLEISKSHEEKIPYSFTRRQSLLNSIRYTTHDLSDLEDKINTAFERAQVLEMQIFCQLIEKIIAMREQIISTARSIAIIDVSAGLAQCAIQREYSRPVITEESDFRVKNGRHAIVEAIKTFEHTQFIANDCILENEQKTWLLTGPNMAGKSTFLRQNALLIILAQIGSFVPADEFTLGCVNKLFARIGASDDLAMGRSTFMVEMIETATILRNANDKSFVILDEIGRGTSTYDGLAIAWACLEHIIDEKKCRCIFATHYHEITKMPHITCYKMCVSASTNDDIAFLYKVKEGAAQSSYGIQVAKAAGMPNIVIERSKELLAQFNS
jgi:DNA mismatch repair protein MutS